MKLLEKAHHRDVIDHFNTKGSVNARVYLQRPPEYEEVALIQRSELQPYYYWLELKQVPHKRAHAVRTAYAGPAFESVEQLLQYHTLVEA